MTKQKSSIIVAIESKHDAYAGQLSALAKQFATIKGLQNLGSTRITSAFTIVRILQLNATMSGCHLALFLLLYEHESGAKSDIS